MQPVDMISVLVLHAQRGPDLPSTRPAQPHLPQVACAAQMCHGRIEVKKERNTCARPNWACSYAPTMTECAFRRKAAQMFRVRFRFWRADDLQMACITSAKPPGTQKSHVRARDVSPSRSTMLFDRGYNASKRPSISSCSRSGLYKHHSQAVHVRRLVTALACSSVSFSITKVF
jgi:hypothetical protein